MDKHQYFLVCFAVITVTTSAVSIPAVSKPAATQARLWELKDETNSQIIKNFAVHNTLKTYAEYCCHEVWKLGENCYVEHVQEKHAKQINYYAYLPQKQFDDYSAEKLIEHLNINFNPKNPPKGRNRDQMCNCMRDNDEQVCQEYPDTENNVRKQRYFARPSRTKINNHEITVHGEKQLLDQIHFLAEKNRKQGRYYFMYSTNGPCSADSTDAKSCINKIFDEVVATFYNKDANDNLEPFHFMRVGFWKWFAYEGSTQLEHRNKFCDLLDKQKELKRNKYDFKQTLRFTKINVWNNDQMFYNELPSKKKKIYPC